MPSETDIIRILRDEVKHAREAYQSAYAEFKTISIDIPSGLPAPDGELRIRNAAVHFRTLLAKFDQAASELNAFTKEGIVPERLKNPCRQCASLTRELKSRERDYDLVLQCVAAAGETGELVLFQKFDTKLSHARTEQEQARQALEKHREDGHARN